MASVVFLDLYGVLADSARMEGHYVERMAAILHREHGGSLARWTELQAASYEWYLSEGAKLDALPGEEREGDRWVNAVWGLNGNQIRWLLERAGVPVPADLAAYSERLERETVCGIDAVYTDVRATLAELRAAGHRLFLSTNANASNGVSALIGGGIHELFDGLVFLENAKAKKDRPYYWKRAFEIARADPQDAVCVDDVLRFLSPAADLGARAVQVVRPELSRDVGTYPVIHSLADLPGLVADQSRTRSRRR